MVLPQPGLSQHRESQAHTCQPKDRRQPENCTRTSLKPVNPCGIHTVCRRDSCSRGKMIFPFYFFENHLNHTGCRLNGISFVCGHQKEYEKGKWCKKTSCVHWLFCGGRGVKRSLAVIKGQLNCGEVKGDWLVSGEGTLGGVTRALQEPQSRAALAGSGKGGAGHNVPLSVAVGREAQSLTPTQPFPALEKKICFSLCKSTTFT